MSFQAAQSAYDNRSLPELPEPTEEDLDIAFDELVQDTSLLLDYIDAEGPDTITAFQLFHRDGLPCMDFSEKDDNLRDSYLSTLTAFFDGYRAWLGDRLTARADQVMQKRIQDAKDEAAEAAADDRFLNGGW